MPSHRTLAALAATAAAVLLPAAAADARTERFVASFRIEQTTTWAEPTIDTTVGCDRVFYERYGRETAVLRTTPIRVRFTPVPGGSVSLAYGPYGRPVRGGLPGEGTVERTYVHRGYQVFGPCTPSPGESAGRENDVDKACDQRFRSRIRFVGLNHAFSPIISGSLGLQLGALTECQVERPAETTGPLTAIPANLTARRIFGSDEYVILSARKTFRQGLHGGEGSTTTQVRWTLRMRRAR